MQTFLAALIVAVAIGYLAWQWMPRRAQASVTHRTAASTGCDTCVSCGGCPGH